MSVRWEVQDLFVSSVGSRGIIGDTNARHGSPIRIGRFPAAKGVRELLIRKCEGGTIGITACCSEGGKVHICYVARRSPAYFAGLRYGDEILCVEDETLPLGDLERLRQLVRNNIRNSIKLRTKDKPGERHVTVTRDVEKGYGFRFVNGEITFVRSNTSAEQRGLERRLQIIEVNEEVVVGMQDEDIESIICANGDMVTLCVVPVNIYRQLFSKLSPNKNDSSTTVEM